MTTTTRTKLQSLIDKWRKDASTYAKQGDEIRKTGADNSQHVSANTFLRLCAQDLEQTMIEIIESEYTK